MKLGLALPHYDFSFPDGEPVTVARVVDYAGRAEDAGFDSVWVSDHLFFGIERYGGPPGRIGTPEAFAMLGAIAQNTERVRLGSLVLCAPFRHPSVLRRQVASLQEISEGRLEIGLGAGWYEPEFAEAGIPLGSFSERARSVASAAAAVRDLAPTFVGGKGGPKLMRVIAEHAAGWNISWWVDPAGYRETLGTLRDECARASRDPAALRLSVGLYTLIGRDEDDLARRFENLKAWAPGGLLDHVTLEKYRSMPGLIGSLQECAARIKEFEALGVDEVIVSLGALPFSVHDDEQLALAGSELAALVR